MSQTPLKKFPSNCTKADVVAMYIKLSEKYVRNVINAAILNTNKQVEPRLQRSIYVRSLNRTDMEYIVDTLGDAPGYEPFKLDHNEK